MTLDALRGAAALVVCVHHTLLTVPAFANAYFRPDPDSTSGVVRWMLYSPIHLLWEGTGAVLLFFVLSGFVLTRSMLEPQRDRTLGERWVPYYAKRLLRLYLPVWCAVGYAWLLAALIENPHTGSAWLAYRHAHGGDLASVVQDVGLLGNPGALISPLWSLRWEVLFSLLLPLFVLAVRWRPLAIPLLVASFWAIDAEPHFGIRAMSYLPMFLIGAVVAANLDVVRKIGDVIERAPFASLSWCLLVGVAALPVYSRWVPGYAPRHWMALTTAASVVLVVAALESSLAHRILTRPWLLWLGAVSFSLYLLHEPTLVAVSLLVGPGHTALSVPLALVAAIGVAAAFYHLVERRLHRVAKHAGDRVAGALRRRRAAVGAHVAVPPHALAGAYGGIPTPVGPRDEAPALVG